MRQKICRKLRKVTWYQWYYTPAGKHQERRTGSAFLNGYSSRSKLGRNIGKQPRLVSSYSDWTPAPRVKATDHNDELENDMSPNNCKKYVQVPGQVELGIDLCHKCND